MVHKGMADIQPPEESGSNEEASAGGLEATRGMDLGGLLGGLLGGQQSTEVGAAGLGGLLTALAGGGDTLDLAGLAPETGLSHSALQAVVPLILGALLGQAHGGAGDAAASKAALVDLAQGKAGAADALVGTGLLQEIMRRTGLDKSGALGVIMAVLKALGLGKMTSSGHTTAKPKPKPHAKPKPKPKPSSHAASSKPKPKPASHTSASSAKPKPKPKPRPKRSGEVDETAA